MKDAGRLPLWTTDFADACRTWARFVRIAEDFRRRHPDRAYTVTNESLITDPEGAMRNVLDFLALPQEAAPARFLRSNRINSSFAGSGKSDDAPPALTEPWREWLPEQHEVFFENAGEMMIDCGLAAEAELRAGLLPRDADENAASRTATGGPLPGLPGT
jgi:Sulfotransferase family